MMAAPFRGIRPLLAAGALALAAWPFVFASAYDHRLLAISGIYALVVLGYQLVFGHVGALALTQGAFFGLGAYAAGLLAVRWGWPFELTAVVAVLAPVALALAVAMPVMRLESHYFALATLGISQIVLLVAIQWESLTGGANGVSGVPPLQTFGATIASGLPQVAMIWSVVVIGAAFVWRLTRGAWGLAAAAVRGDPVIAAVSGIDSARMRLSAFVIGAALAGIAGALHVRVVRVVSPDTLEFAVMVTCLAMTVIGGRTRVAGAIVGAMLLIHLPEWLRILERHYLIAYGAGMLAMIVLAPDGLVGLCERLRERLRPENPPSPPAPTKPSMPVPPAGAPSPLAAKKVGKRFDGVEALADVSLTVSAGEIVGVIGPNGSGKTTLLNVLSGLIEPDRGEVWCGARPTASWPSYAFARAGVGRTFQTPKLIDDLAVIDNVALARLAPPVSEENKRRTVTRARSEAMWLLARLGIAEFAAVRCAAVPHGVRRRVEIARALARAPRVLLLDEPAAGLSGDEQSDLAARLSELTREGLALVVVEHRLGFLRQIADRLICLSAGRLIAEGSPEEVVAEPAVIAAYIGSES